MADFCERAKITMEISRDEIERLKSLAYDRGYNQGVNDMREAWKGAGNHPGITLRKRIHVLRDIMAGLSTEEVCRALRRPWDGKYGPNAKEIRRALKEEGFTQYPAYSPRMGKTVHAWFLEAPKGKGIDHMPVESDIYDNEPTYTYGNEEDGLPI